MALLDTVRRQVGTSLSFFIIGIGSLAFRLKQDGSGGVVIRDYADANNKPLTASQLNSSAGTVQLTNGSNVTQLIGNGTGSASPAWTLPAADGSPNQVLSTNGSGALGWVSAASTTALVSVHEVTLAYNATSPVALFTLPANAEIQEVAVLIDTAFSGGTGATVTVGVTGITAKYMGSTDNDLTTSNRQYITEPGLAADTSSESLIATYSAGSATAGSARVRIKYAVPSST